MISISAAPIALTSGVTCRRIIPRMRTEIGSAFEPPRNCETITSSSKREADAQQTGHEDGRQQKRQRHALVNTRQRLAPRSAAASSSVDDSEARRAWMMIVA